MSQGRTKLRDVGYLLTRHETRIHPKFRMFNLGICRKIAMCGDYKRSAEASEVSTRRNFRPDRALSRRATSSPSKLAFGSVCVDYLISIFWRYSITSSGVTTLLIFVCVPGKDGGLIAHLKFFTYFWDNLTCLQVDFVSIIKILEMKPERFLFRASTKDSRRVS